MADEDEKPPAPSKETVAVDRGVTRELASNPVTVLNASSLVLAEPVTLIQGLRYLQKRIPEFEQLPLGKQQSMARAAHLDPEFIDAGVLAADAWEAAKAILGSSGPELRDEADEIRRWDEVELELKALLKGVSHANLKRKHRLGKKILMLYSFLGMNPPLPGTEHLRQHYENMKQVYLKTLKKARRKARKKEGEGETPEKGGEG